MPVRNPRRIFHWDCSAIVNSQYESYLNQLGEAEPQSDEYEALVDKIRSLPGFPAEYGMPADHLFPNVTSVTMSGRIH